MLDVPQFFARAFVGRDFSPPEIRTLVGIDGREGREGRARDCTQNCISTMH
jgi:hypothetical protein